MAALPPADGVAKVTFAQECSGRDFGTKLFVLNGAIEPWALADLETLVNAMSTIFQARLAKYQDPPVFFAGTIAQDMSTAMGLEAQHLTGTNGSFAGTEMLPLNCQARVTFPTSYRYRGGRPGFNLTGLDKSVLVDERSIQGAAVDDIIADVFALVHTDVPAITLTTGHPSVVIVSYFTGHALRGVPLVTPVNTVEVQTRICTLRKRLGKGEAG